MPARNALITLFCAVLAFAVLYLPQPLLPMLADNYGADMATASLLITATLFPLGLAPLLYGYLLESLSARTLLRWGFGLLAISFVLMLLSESMDQLIATRLLQGLILPAIITALMTYTAISAPPGKVRRFVSIYIASTIVGGFSGRAISGVLSDYLGWPTTLVFWLVLIVIAFFLLGGLQRDAEAHFSKPDLGLFRRVLARPGYTPIYAFVFLMFFIFATLLNFLPFRLREISPDISESLIASIYFAYLVGALISFNIGRLSQWFGGDLRTLIAGLIIYSFGSLLFLSSALSVAFFAMLLFCAGMFLLHATLSGLVNHLSVQNPGVTNGLYLSSYYLGGALGSWLPGYLYQDKGWFSLLLLLLFLILLMGLITRHLARIRVLQTYSDAPT